VSRALLATAVVALLVSGCRCDPGGTGTVDPGFTLVTEEIDFGRVLEGERVQRPVTVQNSTRVDLIIDATLTQPFSAPRTIFVPGGAEETFMVEFRAGDGPAEETLKLEANGGAHEVKVKGIGVRPPNCTPSGPCRDTRYDLESDRCIEGPAPEGSACQTESLCLEKGECRSGQCVGVPRSCDDNDQCTVDSCAPASGCVHTARVCPRPGALCRVATCDPTTGCGDAQAPDFTQCGTFSCVQGSFCISGNCQLAQTPDGFPCAPPTPCQGAGTCQSQTCVRPDAGILTPELTVPLLGHAPSTGAELVSSAGNVYTVLCGPLDAGASDGGLSDGGADGGLDAGAPEGCVVASWTGTGFDRYQKPTADGGERRLGGVLTRVALNGGEVLDTLLASNGSAVSSEPLAGTCGPSGVAHDLVGNLWALARDGGTAMLYRLAQPDGGGAAAISLPAPAEVLAIDEEGSLWAFAPERAWLGRVVVPPDAGALALAEVLDLSDAGLPALSAANGTVAFGGRWLSLRGADGGRSVKEFPLTDDAGFAFEWDGRDALMTVGIGAALFRQCDPPVSSCVDSDKATYVALFDALYGTWRWSARALPPQVPARVVEYAVGRATNINPPVNIDFVATAVVVNFDAGTQSFLEVFADGARTVLCPFPDGTALEAVTWGDGRMYTLSHRDGGYLYEAWDMKGAPLSTTGWPKTNGMAGTRQSR
jgi:hypothetical protein